ncbi:MAG: hypothetical protein V4724_41910 [Pseudomonadota bacterium]
MAIWQFTVGLIPRAWAKFEGNGPELLYDDYGFHDTSVSWRMNQPRADLFGLISNVLPPAESWSDGIKIWGDQTRNYIQVDYDGTVIESVTACIDTREKTSCICSGIIELARALDCFLFLPSAGTIIMADINSLTDALYKSRAAHFSAAPREFIEALARTSAGKS